MNFSELLIACGSGKMPRVIYTGDNHKKIKKGTSGTITTIKDNGRHKGVAVNFGNDWDDWFHESDDTDKRSLYLRDLTIE